MPAETADSFDEEGFFKTGDAVKWIDETDIHQGLKFDGRIAEDFKLATGTFVSVGPLRAKVIAAGAPYIQDVVLNAAPVLAHFQRVVTELAKTATGSSSRIARLCSGWPSRCMRYEPSTPPKMTTSEASSHQTARRPVGMPVELRSVACGFGNAI
jgi:acyl-CoA synthetase (AMP-forming)/AMP-acid ligase II